MKKGDLRTWSTYTVREHYEECRIIEHLDIDLEVIKKDYPDDVEGTNDILDSTMSYFTNIGIMKSKDFANYFQAGVLLIDFEKMRKHNFFESSMKVVRSIEKPRYLDPCILNSTVQKYGFKVKKLDLKWNL